MVIQEVVSLPVSTAISHWRSDTAIDPWPHSSGRAGNETTAGNGHFHEERFLGVESLLNLQQDGAQRGIAVPRGGGARAGLCAAPRKETSRCTHRIAVLPGEGIGKETVPKS